MRRVIHYNFEDSDCPSPKDIREAFNLLYSFCPALVEETHPVCKAYHCVVDNKEFTRDKFIVLYDYAMLVARTAEEKYSEAPWNQAPWRPAVLGSAANLRGAMEGLRHLLQDCHEAETV